ncbi:MAG: DUF2218 domain-containing protein [Pseudomonadota bacterium]
MTQQQYVAVGRFNTQNASRYLQQLCKHFAHKVDVTYDDLQGVAALPTGPARLKAEENELVIELTAKDLNGLAVAQHIIDSHLVRFAFRENFERMSWVQGADAGQS